MEEQGEISKGEIMVAYKFIRTYISEFASLMEVKGGFISVWFGLYVKAIGTGLKIEQRTEAAALITWISARIYPSSLPFSQLTHTASVRKRNASDSSNVEYSRET